jgi:hypothetical protein
MTDLHDHAPGAYLPAEHRLTLHIQPYIPPRTALGTPSSPLLGVVYISGLDLPGPSLASAAASYRLVAVKDGLLVGEAQGVRRGGGGASAAMGNAAGAPALAAWQGTSGAAAAGPASAVE